MQQNVVETEYFVLPHFTLAKSTLLFVELWNKKTIKFDVSYHPPSQLSTSPIGLACVCVEPLFPDPSVLLLPVNCVSAYIVNTPPQTPPATPPLSSVGESSSLLHLLTTRKHWRQLYFDSHHWPPATRSSSGSFIFVQHLFWGNHKQYM